MMKKKMKKVVAYLMSTVMFFSLFLVTPQGVRAEETQDSTEFSGAILVGNGTWTVTGINKTYNVYYNDEPYFYAQTDEAPAKGPKKIMLNQAYKTSMDNTVVGGPGGGGVHGPGNSAYYYFTLEAPAKVTIYGQCSTAADSYLAIQKMDSVDENFAPSTSPLGMVQGTDAVKSMTASLTAGSYLVDLNWGQGRPEKAGTCCSYIKVNADYDMNRETDSVWNETFPNYHYKETGECGCTPYKIGKVMNGVTGIGTCKYIVGYYSFTLSEKTQFHLSELVNVERAYVYPHDAFPMSRKSVLDNAVVLEPGDYILEITAGSESKTYSFNSYTSALPVIAGVDTTAATDESELSVSGETVTINHLTLYNYNVNSGDCAEFCIWSGDQYNAGYGKGTARLVIKDYCIIQKLVIDCPVEVLCEEGARLYVNELVVNTTGEADGKLTYVGGTTYNAETKGFEPCTHKKMSTVGKKDATCTEPGYTGDQTCNACGKVILGQKTDPLGHKWDNGNVTKEPTVLAEGVKTFTCTNPGCKEIKTEAIAKLPEPNNNSNTSAVPVAGVDTIAEEGWSVSGETVTINNLNVNSGDYAEFCIWSGDKENAGYGKGAARLVIKGNCFIKTLVIDCPVEVLCEEGAKLCVGELVVNTDSEADGKLTYVGGTTYNAATKIFEVRGETPTTPENPSTPATPVNPTIPETPPTLVKPGDSLTDTSTKVEYNVINTEGSIPEVACTGTIDKKAKTVTIPDKVEIDGVTYKVTKVDDGAFKGNNTVTTVKVPSTVTTIGKDAFKGCRKLKTVSIPKNVTEIGKNAFKGCAALTKITLPSKCTKIGANAFNGCKKMKTITIKSTKFTSKSIASGAFKGLSKSVTIKVPKKQLKAYKKLLKKKGFKGKVKA